MKRMEKKREYLDIGGRLGPSLWWGSVRTVTGTLYGNTANTHGRGNYHREIGNTLKEKIQVGR